MTTDSTNNSYVRDGRLYIVPTLTVSIWRIFPFDLLFVANFKFKNGKLIQIFIFSV